MTIKENNDINESQETFASLNLDVKILKALAEKGYKTPTPIQAKAIPCILDSRDVLAAAQTGTGKTAGFTLPVLQNLIQGEKVRSNQARTLILTPTRELAAQIHENVKAYSKYLNLRSAVVFGGVSINPQMQALRKGVDVLIATPGRLLDLHQQNAIKFNSLEILVLDEADRMLDMGFIHDIRRILRILPKQRQNLMFSATFSEEIRSLAAGIVNDPAEVSVTPPNSTVETVVHSICPTDKSRKAELLIHLIKEKKWYQVLVFTRTKHGANRLTKKLNARDIKAAAIHGNKSQGARTRALAGFKNDEIQVLVATDIAARGIDIKQLPQVVNFDLPNVPEDYVHRIGRTGRAGMTGQAISLVSADEFKQLSDIERLLQKLLPREHITGFEPEIALPESRLKPPRRAKKPKKTKPQQLRGKAFTGNHKKSESKPSNRRRRRRRANNSNRDTNKTA